MHSILKSLLWILPLLTACASTPRNSTAPAPSDAPPKVAPIVVFMSDFGLLDDGVAICKGVMLGINPDIRFVDLTHQVPPYGVAEASRLLMTTAPYYPAGTVFITLVEKNSGRASVRPIVAKSKRGQFFVMPDNGLLTLIAAKDGLEGIREIGDAWINKNRVASTFVGRDLYSPVAARLARGDDWTGVGPEFKKEPQVVAIRRESVRSGRLEGEVIATEQAFGNLITNMTSAAFLESGYALGEPITVRIGELQLKMPFVKTFEDVNVNEPLIYIDSTDHVALALNQGNFAEKFRVKRGTKISIERKRGRVLPGDQGIRR